MIQTKTEMKVSDQNSHDLMLWEAHSRAQKAYTEAQMSFNKKKGAGGLWNDF
jgi:hypothetical protein